MPVRLAKGTGIGLAVAGATLLAPAVASRISNLVRRGSESLDAAGE